MHMQCEESRINDRLKMDFDQKSLVSSEYQLSGFGEYSLDVKFLTSQ